MLANVFTKAMRDRSVGMLIGAGSVGVMLLFAIAVYRDIDVSFYYQLPQAMIELMGIPPEGEMGGIAFGAMYDMIGAFVLAGIAISMGASAIAGEEREGTFGLLLGNPVSRRGVVLSKVAAIVAVVGIGSLILWAFAGLGSSLMDLDLAGLRVEASILALFLNALVYGSLALAIGSWTGNRGAASGVAVTVMLVGYLGASLLPLVEGLADVARVFPWRYFSSANPLVDGVDWGHMAVLASLCSVFFAIAYVGITRRDIKERGTGVTILDRLRANPRTRRIIEKIAGSARVSGITIKTASEFQGLLVVTSMAMFYLGLMMGPLYSLVPDDFIEFFSGFPDVVIAMIGGADMATAAGFIQGEVFSITAPVAVIVVTVVMGARALAGEEERKTMGLLLGNPVSKPRVIVEKTLAMIGYALVVGLVTFLGTWLGVLLGGVDLGAGEVAAASFLLALLGLVFGGVALLVGAATGRTRLASSTAAGLAVTGYFVWSFFPLSDRLAGWAALSPFEYFLGGDPLTNGMPWGDAAILVVAFSALVAVSVPLFQRRDLRG